jgi:cellulose biosynthesis protein BcsQ
MTGGQDGTYVLIGVGRSRERWFAELGRWSTTGAAPIDFVRCLSPDEALAVLGSGRRASALLVDARGPAIERDLVAVAAQLGVPTVVVTNGGVHRDWDALGCAAVIDADFDRRQLLEVLQAHTAPVDRSRRPARIDLGTTPRRHRSPLVGVVGSGGVGSSTVAMATAQALAAADHDAGGQHGVVLVDGARRGELGMYHDVGDVIPGLPELVEAHRSDRLDPEAVRALTYSIDTRGYDLLLGRRRSIDWVTLRRRSVVAALDSLRRSYDTVVVDLDDNLDGERDTGSADVADRHATSISTLDAADVVIVVGRVGLKGLHALVALLDEVVRSGVPSDRVLPVLNECPRSPAVRAESVRTLSQLCAASAEQGNAVDPPLHLRRIRHLEGTHRDGAALPTALCQPLGRAVTRLLAARGQRSAVAGAEQIRPGDLGSAADAWAITHRQGLGTLDDRSDVA